MEKVFKTYRFKLMPDKEQELLLAKHFGCAGVVYNHFLNERIEQYKKNNRSDNYHAKALALTQLKKQFVNLLHYKCHWYGRELIKIDRFFSCSKTCNACGWLKQDLNLSDREWTCENGHHLDRDLNAAKNILKEGLKRYRQGLSITKAEDDSVYYGSTSDETRSPSIAVA